MPVQSETDGPFVAMSGCLVGGPRNSRPARALGSGHWRRRSPAPTLVVEEGFPTLGLSPAPGCGRTSVVWFCCLFRARKHKSFLAAFSIGCFSGALEVNYPAKASEGVAKRYSNVM